VKKPRKRAPTQTEIMAAMLDRMTAMSEPLSMATRKGHIVPVPVQGGILRHKHYMLAWDDVPKMSRKDSRRLFPLFDDPWDNGRPMTISDLYA
jgi:hypothetical protein